MKSPSNAHSFTGMVRLAGLFLVLTLFAAASPAPSADLYMDSTKTNLLIASQRCLFNDDFNHADSLTIAFSEQFPGDPAVWLMRAAGMMAKMYHAEEELYDSTYKAAVDSLEHSATRVLDTATNRTTRAWMHMWRASAKAYQSLWEAKFGGTFAAVKLGFAARSECEKGLACDSSVIDLYMGLGTYHYWKSAKAGFLRWIGIFKNEKDKGIRELSRAMASAAISRETAESGLIWIWLDKKEYDSTIAFARRMSNRYPRGASFYWPMGTAYFQSKCFDDAAAAFKLLRAKLDPNPGNYYNWIACDSWLARCYEELNQHDAAREIGQRFLAYLTRIPDHTRARQKTNIKYLRKWAER